MPACQQIFNAAIAVGQLTARSRGDPSTECREFPRLREMSQGITLFPESPFQIGTAHACFECGEVAGNVEIDQAIHAAEINGDSGGICRSRIDMPDHAGTSTIGNQARTHATCVSEEVPQLSIRCGVSYAIRKCLDTTVAQCDPVR